MLINSNLRTLPAASPIARPAAKPQLQEEATIPASADGVEISSTSTGSKAPSTADLQQQAGAAAQSAAAAATPGAPGTLLRVLTLNTYFDSNSGLEGIENLIKTTKADLVGLQEVNQSTPILAEKLGMHYVQQDKRTALLSRFPIKEVTPEKYGVKIELDNGKEIGFFNVHATSFPFQPAQIAHKPSGGGPYINNEEQAIRWADWTRGSEFRTLIKEADGLGLPSVATGDFNEPTHLDWTPRAVEAGMYPFKVQWPGSSAFAKAGFKDSYRETHPDEVAQPGRTWPANEEPKPGDPNVRIDYVMHRGEGLKVVSSQIVGESADKADIVVTPYPTDHRSVLTTFEV